MEENQIQDISYKEDLQAIKETIQNNNDTLNNILKYIEDKEQEKKEQEKKEQEEQEILIKEEEEKEEQQQQFYENIELIADNSNSENIVELFEQNILFSQFNIICFGILIGVSCISLFSKFFKR